MPLMDAADDDDDSLNPGPSDYTEVEFGCACAAGERVSSELLPLALVLFFGGLLRRSRPRPAWSYFDGNGDWDEDLSRGCVSRTEGNRR